MKYSEQFELVGAALAKAQADFEVAELNKQNTHFKQGYANLASIREASFKQLSANGLAISQGPRRATELEATTEWELITRLIHTSGQWIEITYPLHVGKQDAQGFAAAMTYARRISWQTITGVVANDDDDDDGETAAGNAAATGISATERASRASVWKTKAVGLVSKLESRDAVEAWRQRFRTTINDLADANSPAYEELAAAIRDRLKALEPVPLDDPRPEPPPPPVDPSAEEALPGWFQKRLDDIPNCDDSKDLKELHDAMMEHAAELSDDLMQLWVERIDVRSKQLRLTSTTRTAQKHKGG